MFFPHEDFEIEVIQSSYTLNSADNQSCDYILNPFIHDMEIITRYYYTSYDIIINRYFSYKKYTIILPKYLDDDIIIFNYGLKLMFIMFEYIVGCNLKDMTTWYYTDFDYSMGVEYNQLENNNYNQEKNYVIFQNFNEEKFYIDFDGNIFKL